VLLVAFITFILFSPFKFKGKILGGATEHKKGPDSKYFKIGAHKFNDILLLFSHPDFTVGFGISPNQSSMILKLSLHHLRVADYTAGREFHPAPKNLPLLFLQIHHTSDYIRCQHPNDINIYETYVKTSDANLLNKQYQFSYGSTR
jgi:hypothetical protein